MDFSTVEEAIEDIKQGKLIIIIDDEDRENEGDFIASAELATPETINFMASFGKGLICMPVSQKIATKLNLHPMVEKNTDNHCTGFTVSIDYKDTSTGISAFDRCLTANMLASDDVVETDFRRPGHMFPLISVEGGILKRRGHTEASVEVCKLAGLKEVALCCEIMDEDGKMARLTSLLEKAKMWNMKIITMEQLVLYKENLKNEAFTNEIPELKVLSKASLPTRYGIFDIYCFENKKGSEPHIALVMGNIKESCNVLCRIHSECFTGDILGSLKCDCGEQLEKALENIAAKGEGILLYMRQEGRGIGLVNKIKAYHLQEENFDTVDANLKLGLPADARDYSECCRILEYFGVKNITLMTNNPLKIKGIENNSSIKVERMALKITPSAYSQSYINTKILRMGHLT